VWELICDHKYQWGTIAADGSPWRTDGIASALDPLPGAGGLRFSKPQSQIVIPRRPGDPWNALGGIIVEMVARFAQPSGTLIDAHQSFRISLSGGVLIGEIPGQQISGGTIEVGRWVRLSFNHNGFNGMSYGFGVLETTGPGFGGGGVGIFPYSQVPPVGPQGILIGRKIGSPAQRFNGDIASVRIMRIDPRSMTDGFLGRPIDPAVADCWAQFLRKLRDALRSDPECADWLLNALTAFQLNFQQALAQKSEEKIKEFRQMCREYRALWSAGRVGSSQMRDLIARMRDWLKAEGLLDLHDPDLLSFAQSPCMEKIRRQLPSLDCDPEIKALIAAIIGERDQSAI
jgi:hypothetical protein